MSIIPDDFDLDKARAKPSKTPKDERDRCPDPDCLSLAIESRTAQGGAGSPRPVEHDYVCRSCGNRFDEPARGEGE